MRTEPSTRGAKTMFVESSSSSQLVQLVEGAICEFAAVALPAELNAFIDYLKYQFPEVRKNLSPDKFTEKREKTAYSFESLEQDLFSSIHKEISSIHGSDFIKDGEGISSEEDTARSSYHAPLLLGKYIASLTKEFKDSSQNGNVPRVEPAVQIPSYDGFGPSDCDGIHVSSCGHAVHQGCLDRYLSSLKERYFQLASSVICVLFRIFDFLTAT